MMRDKITMEMLCKTPVFAEGHVTIDLTDPITGKIKQRVDGKNHVFTEALWAGSPWHSRLSSMQFVLNDSEIALNTGLPFLLGQTVAYGTPSQASLNTFRGAFNAANQVLGVRTREKIRWKYQYDFTTAQANGGTIRNAGLTAQYSGGGHTPLSGFLLSNVGHHGNTKDGRYNFSISSAGVITRHDMYGGTNVTIDVSGIVGSNTSDAKTIGYDIHSKKYYVLVMSGTSGRRFLYEFTNSSFATNSATFPTFSMTLNSAYTMLYVRNGRGFIISGSNIFIFDYVANTAHTTWTVSGSSNILVNEGRNFGYDLNRGTLPFGSDYIWVSGSYYNYYGSVTAYNGCVIDISGTTPVIIGYHSHNNTDAVNAALYPLGTTQIPCLANGTSQSLAVSTYVLPTPITKTSANGMTATYELEVFWE